MCRPGANADAREVNAEFAAHLAQTGEEIMLAFPSVTVARPGTYVLGVSLKRHF